MGSSVNPILAGMDPAVRASIVAAMRGGAPAGGASPIPSPGAPAGTPAIASTGAPVANPKPLATPQAPSPSLSMTVHHTLEPEPPQPISMPQPGMPEIPGAPQPHVIAPRGTLQGDQDYRGHVLQSGSGISQIAHKIEGSDFGQAHPTLAKVLGYGAQGAATLGDIGLSLTGPGRIAEGMIPGTAGYHAATLAHANSAVNQDEENAGKEATTADVRSQIPLRQAQTQEAQQRTEASTPVEITPEQAQSLNMPELAGEKVSPAILARLSGQHQGNVTKSDTADSTVAGREQVAQTGAESRESVAKTNADARQRATDAQDMTRQAVARIRGTAAPKGAGGVTNNSKARGEMSETMLEQAPGILQEIDALNDKIGPGAGRWNNFWVKKGGANDPDYAGLDQDLGLYASALAVAHFGSRGGGAHFIDAMKKDFSQAQSPEDLKARILHADKWLEGYENEGKGNAPGGAGTPPPGAQIIKWEDVK